MTTDWNKQYIIYSFALISVTFSFTQVGLSIVLYQTHAIIHYNLSQYC